MASAPLSVSQEVPHGPYLIGGPSSLLANRRRVRFSSDLREDDFMKKYICFNKNYPEVISPKQLILGQKFRV